VSQENVELVELAKSFHSAFDRDGWEALWRVADPEIEFTSHRSSQERAYSEG
jgi:hypothetical protein